ncbi:4'-phosphopantetheinyl transferase superfamily protein [Neisseria dentiae]|uniref:4'-phosphopantetheinyl transferase family protein n=1 Tax=Neisseria dentiae TaxID=194197 RepID=UPI00359F969A
MNTPRLICLIADNRTAALYRPDALNEADRLRVQRNPALATRTDWQVSRYLKQQAPLPVCSLSHSKGAAALLCGCGAIKAGTDIEAMRPRDFAALAGWVATENERRILSANGWQADGFYRLWTLKEALLKAAGLDFPADMMRVGLQTFSDGLTCLHVNGRRGWQGISTTVNGSWMLSCVWHGQAEIELQTLGGSTCGPVKRYG